MRIHSKYVCVTRTWKVWKYFRKMPVEFICTVWLYMKLIATWKNSKTGSALFFISNGTSVSGAVTAPLYLCRTGQNIWNRILNEFMEFCTHPSIQYVCALSIRRPERKWMYFFLKRLKLKTRSKNSWKSELSHFLLFFSLDFLASFFYSFFYAIFQVIRFILLLCFKRCAWWQHEISFLNVAQESSTLSFAHILSLTLSLFHKILTENEWHERTLFLQNERETYAKKNPIVAMKKAFFSHFC